MSSIASVYELIRRPLQHPHHLLIRFFLHTSFFPVQSLRSFVSCAVASFFRRKSRGRARFHNQLRLRKFHGMEQVKEAPFWEVSLLSEDAS